MVDGGANRPRFAITFTIMIAIATHGHEVGGGALVQLLDEWMIVLFVSSAGSLPLLVCQLATP